MITIQIGRLKSIMAAMDMLRTKDMPIAATFKILRIYRKLAEAFADFEAARRELILKHAVKDDEGKIAAVDDQAQIINMAAFQHEFNELAEPTTDIDIEPIEATELGDIQISPVTLASLEGIVTLPDEVSINGNKMV